MENKLPSFLLDQPSPVSFKQGKGRIKMGFLEEGIHHLAQLIKKGYVQWELSSGSGLFQKIDARVKVLFLLFFVIIVNLKRDLLSELYIGGFIFSLALLSRIRIVTFYSRVLFLGFFLGFLIAFPSAFNVITNGEMVGPVIRFSKPINFWIYHIPAEVGITREGIYGVIRLTLRVINSLSLSFLVLYTTPFSEILRALKVLKVPDTFIIIITLCFKYIFIFSKTAEDMHLSKKSRMVREATHAEAREWIAGRVAFIFMKTRLRYEEVFKAMIGRGFSDTIKLYGFPKMRTGDCYAGTFLLFTGVFFLFI
ncbi:MAG: cobalt ECF transporter T component CbiQ [Deltaproteobacteria bacterium RBG_16_49_23]|nr:MAG: cobalt ECF transporter T component CbiQ [Deltaproteobacteria bacterium RBG_16_49_23]